MCDLIVLQFHFPKALMIMEPLANRQASRRQFIRASAAGAAVTLASPYVATAKKTKSEVVLGSGEHQYRVVDQWPQLPDPFHWQITHNVACGTDGTVYVIHEGREKDPPAIFAFDEKGTYIRSFGSQFQGGGHGLEVRQENGEDFLYVTAYHSQRSFAKLTARGETVWHQYAPLEAGGYAKGEEIAPRKDNPWGRNRFMPTNYAFHPDGGFYLADGYGSWRIHRYNAEGKWLSCFGKAGDGKAKTVPDGEMRVPHGLWIDDRGEESLLAVADRFNRRLQWFTLEGQHVKTLDGFKRPANVDIYHDTMLVPEIDGRVTLLDKENEVLARFGEKPIEGAGRYAPKSKDESTWQVGRFIAPHDACFDASGNIFVAERVHRGRVTKLEKVV